MQINDFLYHTSEWLKGTGPHSDIVMSIRIRLARNLDKTPFPHWANKKQAKDTLENIVRNGKLLGTQLWVVAEETYNGGQKEGLCSKYYKSGERLESSWWKGDRREGLYRAFYTNGRPYLECRYAGGARNGPCVSYHPSAEAEIEAFNQNDLPHGPWKYYDEKGTLLITLHYDRGLLLNADQLRKLDSARLEELEKQRGRLVDPENYLQNPEEILFRKP